MSKVVFAIAGRKDSYPIAEKMIEEQVLSKYITAVYNKKGSLIDLFCKYFFKKNSTNYKRLMNRRVDKLTPYVIQKMQFLGLIELYLTLKNISPKILNKLRYFITDYVNINALKYAKKNKIDTVVMYITKLTDKPFKYRDKFCKNIKIIVYVTGALPKFVKDIYEYENNTYITNRECPFSERELRNCDYIAQNADGFLAISSYVKKSLCFCGADKNKVKIINYGIDERKIKKPKEDYECKEKCIKFIYVGRVEFLKGVHHLLSVFSKLSGECELHIVGNYSLDESIVKDYKEHKNIIFYGEVLNEEVMNILKRSDVFVFPTLTDGFGGAPIEALMSGLPVIVTDNCGCADVVKNGENGFVVPHSDEDALMEKMMYFIKNKCEIERMGRNAAKLEMPELYANFNKMIQELIVDEK